MKTTPVLALPLAAIAAAAALAPASASAISMRDDVANVNSTGNDNPYVALGATFNAVAFIQFTVGTSSFVGSGTLVNSTVPGQFKLLTAAHNVDTDGAAGGGPNGVADAANYTVYFGARTSGDGSTATGSVVVPRASVSIQPRWVTGDGMLSASASQYDLAVFTFTLSSVTGVLPNPYGLSLANPQGQTGTTVGFGNFGVGSTFANNSADGVRRAGRNTIDVLGNPSDSAANTGFTLQTDFDSPNDTTKSTLGSTTPLPLEASTAGGDSGGPLLVGPDGNPLIVGVLNGGFNPKGNVSEYGDRSIWASVNEPSNLQFLMGAGVAVPEPSTFALSALGLVSLVGYVRRRRSTVA